MCHKFRCIQSHSLFRHKNVRMYANDGYFSHAKYQILDIKMNAGRDQSLLGAARTAIIDHMTVHRRRTINCHKPTGIRKDAVEAAAKTIRVRRTPIAARICIIWKIIKSLEILYYLLISRI